MSSIFNQVSTSARLSRLTSHAQLKSQWILTKANFGSFYVQWNGKKIVTKLNSGRKKSEIIYSYSPKGIGIA